MNIPKVFSIETVHGCNLRCPICAVGCGKATRPRKHMSIDEFNIIADKIEKYATMVALHVWGEPMLNKDIFSIIKRTREFAIAGIHTNANCMSDEDAKRLALSGATISVSLDGMTQETYSTYRVGGNLQKTIHIIQEIKKHHSAANMTSAFGAQFLVFDHNKHEIPDFISFCKSLNIPGTTKVPQVKLNPVLTSSHKRPPFNINDVLACTNPFDVCTILVNGDVVICCYDYNGQVVFGNIFSQSIEEIWNGPERKSLIDSIKNGKPHPFCMNCLMFS